MNLDPVQRYTLNILKKSSKHVVIPADKNLGPVIIERDQYILSVLSLLRDQRTYQQLTKEEACSAINDLHKSLRTFLWTHLDNFGIDAEEHTYLTRSIDQSTDKLSHFYIIAKIHKTPWKPRPIVSYCGSLLYGLGKWINSQLQPIAKSTAAYISSSFHLCDELKTLRIDPSRDTLFTADANAMYTNIDTDHALRVLRTFFKTHILCRPIWHSADMILEALELLMRNNLFQFGDTYWKQIDDTAMGAPPAPAYAALYYAIHKLYLI